MAQDTAQGQWKEPAITDSEGVHAAHWLHTKIWKEMYKEHNKGLRGGKRIPEEAFHGPDYHAETLARIDADEKLVLDGWSEGHGKASYHKKFATHTERARAQQLMKIIEMAEKVNDLLPRDDLPELPPEPETRALKRRLDKHADVLAVRSDWLEAFAAIEKKPVGVIR